MARQIAAYPTFSIFWTAVPRDDYVLGDDVGAPFHLRVLLLPNEVRVAPLASTPALDYSVDDVRRLVEQMVRARPAWWPVLGLNPAVPQWRQQRRDLPSDLWSVLTLEQLAEYALYLWQWSPEDVLIIAYAMATALPQAVPPQAWPLGEARREVVASVRLLLWQTAQEYHAVLPLFFDNPVTAPAEHVARAWYARYKSAAPQSPSLLLALVAALCGVRLTLPPNVAADPPTAETLRVALRVMADREALPPIRTLPFLEQPPPTLPEDAKQ